jgi:hypothetical protein
MLHTEPAANQRYNKHMCARFVATFSCHVVHFSLFCRYFLAVATLSSQPGVQRHLVNFYFIEYNIAA